MDELLSTISSIVWGPAMLALLLGTGLFLTIGLRFLPIRRIGYAFRLAFEGRRAGKGNQGDITPFQALTTALSATIGTGNIAGVATAIYLGGPGAVVWMWITALVGMAVKYAEAVLAVTYREVDDRGRYVGGPMYYIRNGLGRRWHWLGAAFALFAMIAAFGIGNTVQANSVARVLEQNLSVPYWITGAVMAALTFAVIIGGVKRIAGVAEFLVPFMAARLHHRRHGDPDLEHRGRSRRDRHHRHRRLYRHGSRWRLCRRGCGRRDPFRRRARHLLQRSGSGQRADRTRRRAYQ